MNIHQFIAVTTASAVARRISEEKVTKTSPETSPEVNNKDGDNKKMDIFLSICIILLMVFLVIIFVDLLGDGALIERLYAIDAKVEKWLGNQLFILDTEVNEWFGLN